MACVNIQTALINSSIWLGEVDMRLAEPAASSPISQLENVARSLSDPLACQLGIVAASVAAGGTDERQHGSCMLPCQSQRLSR